MTLTVCVIPVNPLTLMYSFKDEMAIQPFTCYLLTPMYSFADEMVIQLSDC